MNIFVFGSEFEGDPNREKERDWNCSKNPHVKNCHYYKNKKVCPSTIQNPKSVKVKWTVKSRFVHYNITRYLTKHSVQWDWISVA